MSPYQPKSLSQKTYSRRMSCMPRGQWRNASVIGWALRMVGRVMHTYASRGAWMASLISRQLPHPRSWFVVYLDVLLALWCHSELFKFYVISLRGCHIIMGFPHPTGFHVFDFTAAPIALLATAMSWSCTCTILSSLAKSISQPSQS